MTRNQRLWLLVLCGLAIVALALLAAGLPMLEFSPGYNLPSDAPEEPTHPVGLPSRSRLLEYLYMAAMVAALVLLPLAVVYLLSSPEGRKRLLRNVLILSLLLALFVLPRTRPEPLPEEAERLAPPVSLEAPTLPGDEFAPEPPGAPSEWLVWLASAGLALLAATGLVGLAWLVRCQRRPSAGSLDLLAREAKDALADLRSGRDLRDAVMRCYHEMSRVLAEERGLVRGIAMTPREFEVTLAEKGLPQQHVRTLTRLFEAVRYGAKPPGESEERQAVDCLEAIVDACEART